MFDRVSQTVSKRAVFIFILAASFFFYDFIGQVYPGIIASDLMRDFSITATQFGVMASCFYYAYTFMQVPAAILIDKFGARCIITLAFLLCAINFFGFSLSHNVYSAALLRFMMGASAAFSFVGALYLVVRWFPPKYFALLSGILAAMGSISAMIADRPLAEMMTYFGWRTALSWIASIGLILAILFFIVVRNQPLSCLTSHFQSKITFKKRLTMVFSHKQTWFISLLAFVLWAPVLAFIALWSIPFLEIGHQFSLLQATKAVSFAWLGIAVGSPLIGWLSEKIKRRCLPISIGSSIAFIAISILIYVPPLPFFWVCLLLFFIGLASSGFAITFAIARDIHSPDTRNIASGVINTFGVLPGIVFQPLIGKFLDMNWQGTIIHNIRLYDIAAYQEAFISLPICYIIALILTTRFIKETHCRNRHNDDPLTTNT